MSSYCLQLSMYFRIKTTHILTNCCTFGQINILAQAYTWKSNQKLYKQRFKKIFLIFLKRLYIQRNKHLEQIN